MADPSTALIAITPTYLGIPIELQATLDAAVDYLRAQKAPATLRAYQSDFALFRQWCEQYNLATEPATPQTIILFLATQARAGLSIFTLERRLSAIRYVHQLKDLPSPTDHHMVRGELAGIRRTHGSKSRQVKNPLMDYELIQMLALCGNDLIGVRDRAILALGFAGAFRRSELAALEIQDLHFDRKGHLICYITRSKTDQAGEGFEKPIYNGERIQPVTYLRDWLTQSGLEDGPVFRRIDWGGAALPAGLSGQWIARIVQRYSAAMGIDHKLIAAHSLRSGFITSAGEHNATLYKIMEITGQKDPKTVLRYLRRPNLFRDHVGEKFL